MCLNFISIIQQKNTCDMHYCNCINVSYCLWHINTYIILIHTYVNARDGKYVVDNVFDNGSPIPSLSLAECRTPIDTHWQHFSY